ncbi:MAG: hypothetical protein IKI57_02220 [Clostridia bacterium]|nr:hypothetical protein [Clostridia bacterium]
MKKGYFKNGFRSILKIFWFILNFAANFIGLAFVVCPIIYAFAKHVDVEATLVSVWDKIDSISSTGILPVDYLYRALKELWIIIGQIPMGNWIQMGIVVIVAIESIRYFTKPIRTGFAKFTNLFHRESKVFPKLKGTMSKGASSFDPDAEGYKNWHPGEKGPMDNVPPELIEKISHSSEESKPDEEKGNVVSIASFRKKA